MASANTGGAGDALELNLMPMLDIFSILITFLLMSYSTDPVSHDVPSGLELPESVTLSALDELPSIIVTKTEIMVNDKKVATIVGGDVAKADMNQGAVYPVFQELEKLAASTKAALRGRLDEVNKAKLSTLTMEMDEQHRFVLMRRIMLAAQQAEFITFKLVVNKQDN